MEDILKHFRGEERYNCAQAVLKGFQEKYNIPQETIDAAKANGGGRAEGGLCGALHSAKQILKNKNQEQELETRFHQTAGAIHCKAIRKLNLLPCAGCVQAAAQLLHQLDS